MSKGTVLILVLVVAVGAYVLGGVAKKGGDSGAPASLPARPLPGRPPAWRIVPGAASLRPVAAAVGVVLSYAVLWTGVAGPGSSTDMAQEYVCARGELCAPTMVMVAEEPATYATPVEVDCRAISQGNVGTSAGAIGRNDLELFSGPCGPVISDFRYRVSRFADSERPSGGLGPQRARRATRAAATCTGLPPDHGKLVLASVPPIAMYAAATVPLPPPGIGRMGLDRDRPAPTRNLEPPDRPPRR